jgi:hypothetical protein
MAEEYNPNPQPHHHHNEESVESTDRGLFDFIKKKEEAEKPVQEEQVFVSEFDDKVQISEHVEEKKHDHHETLAEKFHRSDSSSSSSSDEEGDEEEKQRKKKEKKSIKDKLKEKLHKKEEKHEEERVEMDTEVPVEKIYVGEPVEKIHVAEPVEKIHVEEVVYSEPSHPVEEKKGILEKIKEKLPGHNKKPEDVAVPPPPPVAPVAAECDTPPEHEKKGFMDKIKEKIPGFHHKSEEEKEKEKD